MKYISAFFLIFCVAVIVLADSGNLPRPIRVIYDFPNGDKLGHFILFGALDLFHHPRISLLASFQIPKLGDTFNRLDSSPVDWARRILSEIFLHAFI